MVSYISIICVLLVEKCVEYLENSGEEEIKEKAEENRDNASTGLNSIFLPDAVLENIVNSAAEQTQRHKICFSLLFPGEVSKAPRAFGFLQTTLPGNPQMQ